MGLDKLGIRAAVTILLGPLVLLLAWLGGLFFFSLMAIIAALALYEFFKIGEEKQGGGQAWLGVACGVALCWIGFENQWSKLLPLLSGFTLLTLTIELFRNRENALLNMALTLAGPIYIGLPMALLVSIRQLPRVDGGHIVIMIFLCIWICDSAAYLLGSRIGKHRLFPRVSPNKTVEGTIGGLMFGIITAWISQSTFAVEFSTLQAIIVGAICGSVGQLSDLVESLFKRDAGIKDSSNLIPGHGGILDRFDSELLAVPVIYFYLITFVRG